MSNASATTIDLSPQEAEAVLELWAKKQAEGELRSRLNVQDLAEAMSLPVEEVEKMVDTVRQKASSPTVTPPVKRAKPINSLLISLAVIVWFTILAGACYFAFEAGTDKGRQMAGQAAMAPPALNDYPAEIAVATGPPPMPEATFAAAETPVHGIPRSVSVEIKGYKVYGEQRQNASEREILGSLKQILEEVAPPSTAKPEVVYGDVATMNALQENNPAKVDGQIQFEAMTVQGKGTGMTLMIPIAKVTNPDLVRLVEEEQTTRLKILANWVYNQRGNPPLPRPGNP